MLKIIERKDIDKIIESHIKNKKRLIITGLDGSGKSTILSKYFSKTKVLKTDADTTYKYHQSKVVRELVDNYILYDRHPIIDGLVYKYASLDEDGLDNAINRFEREFNRQLKYRESYDSVIIILDDKFVSKTTQNKWIKKLRQYIIKYYTYISILLSLEGKVVYLIDNNRNNYAGFIANNFK